MSRGAGFLLALVCLICFAPVFLLIGLWVLLVSRGPVFFLQERIGFRERVFWVIKFRTMHLGAEAGDSQSVTVKNDPRLIPGARFIRKYKIDETPQIINVLLGTMSFVGPRPTVLSDFERMDSQQRGRFTVCPGITGLAQIRGGTELKWPQRIALDLEYIRVASLRLDIIIILQTFALVFSGRADTHPKEATEW